MAKSVLVAYILWIFGGWFGLHHFYLGRDRQAFVWWCLFPGYGAVGWFGDIFRIPKYVSEANYDQSYVEYITEKMRKKPKPPFSFYKFIGQIMFGNLLAWVIYRAIPDEPVFGVSLHLLHFLIPLGSAIGVHTVGNIGREKGTIKWALIAAYLPYIAYTYQDPHYYVSSFLAALAFRRTVTWDRDPPIRRHICKRLLILGACAALYIALWSSFLYFNMEMTNEHGEPIKFRESVKNILNSPMWGELSDSLSKLYRYAQIHGWRSVWNEVMGQLDPMGERNALHVLDLPQDASQEQIVKRWRELSRKYHPDKFKDPAEKAAAQDKFIQIKEAYEKLSDLHSSRKRKNSRSRPRQG